MVIFWFSPPEFSSRGKQAEVHFCLASALCCYMLGRVAMERCCRFMMFAQLSLGTWCNRFSCVCVCVCVWCHIRVWLRNSGSCRVRGLQFVPMFKCCFSDLLQDQWSACQSETHQIYLVSTSVGYFREIRFAQLLKLWSHGTCKEHIQTILNLIIEGKYGFIF